MKIIDRLDKYMDYSNLNDNKITVSSGLSVGLLGKARSGDGDLGKKAIDKILKNYQDLNNVWLLTGEGEMLRSSTTPTQDLTTIPLYSVEASAGTGLVLGAQFVEDYVRVPNIRPTDIAVHAIGDSMTPEIHSGDILFIRLMPNWLEYLEYGAKFIIATDDEVFCKVIHPSNDHDSVTLRSINPNYPDFCIPKRCIRQVYKVLGTYSKKSM